MREKLLRSFLERSVRNFERGFLKERERLKKKKKIIWEMKEEREALPRNLNKRTTTPELRERANRHSPFHIYSVCSEASTWLLRICTVRCSWFSLRVCSNGNMRSYLKIPVWKMENLIAYICYSFFFFVSSRTFFKNILYVNIFNVFITIFFIKCDTNSRSFIMERYCKLFKNCKRKK